MKQLFALLILTVNPLVAQEWKELSLKEFGYIVGATSELKDGAENEEKINYKYGIRNLSDGNLATAWVEGVKGNGIGESVYLVVPNDCQTINIFAGYGKNSTTYTSNNRVKRIRLSCYIGINPEGGVTELDWLGYISKKFPGEFHIDLKDVASLQTFNFPFSYEDLYSFRKEVSDSFRKDYNIPFQKIQVILQIEIEDVYKGSKFDDTCISELSFSTSRNGIIITKVYEDGKNKSAVLFDTNKKKGNILLSDTSYVYWIMDTIPNNEWVRIERAPAKVGEGRVETEDFLYYVPEKKEFPLPLNALDFQMKYGIAYLNTSDDKIIPLSDFLDDLAYAPAKMK